MLKKNVEVEVRTDGHAHIQTQTIVLALPGVFPGRVNEDVCLKMYFAPTEFSAWQPR